MDLDNQSKMLYSTAKRYVNHHTHFKLRVKSIFFSDTVGNFSQILPFSPLESPVVHIVTQCKSLISFSKGLGTEDAKSVEDSVQFSGRR